MKRCEICNKPLRRKNKNNLCISCFTDKYKENKRKVKLKKKKCKMCNKESKLNKEGFCKKCEDKVIEYYSLEDREW